VRPETPPKYPDEIPTRERTGFSRRRRRRSRSAGNPATFGGRHASSCSLEIVRSQRQDREPQRRALDLRADPVVMAMHDHARRVGRIQAAGRLDIMGKRDIAVRIERQGGDGRSHSGFVRVTDMVDRSRVNCPKAYQAIDQQARTMAGPIQTIAIGGVPMAILRSGPGGWRSGGPTRAAGSYGMLYRLKRISAPPMSNSRTRFTGSRVPPGQGRTAAAAPGASRLE
jgi:hypothetical protein